MINSQRIIEELVEMATVRKGVCPREILNCVQLHLLKKYIEKLTADIEYFWQQPNNCFNSKKITVWYWKIPVGKNILGEKMKALS